MPIICPNQQTRYRPMGNTFISDVIESEYFYYNGLVNWLLSYGFTKGSLNEMRKSKASKTKKPFFSLSKGWYSYGDIE